MPCSSLCRALLCGLLPLTRSAADAHWDCFWFGVIVNTVPVNILEHVCCYVYVSVECIPRS